MKVLIVYNQPVLPAESPDAASEAGVLESVDAVHDALTVRGHGVQRLALGDDPLAAAAAIGAIEAVDVVFNLFEGFAGLSRGEAEITGLIELLGHAMTGSPGECLGLVRDKARTKWLLAGAGIPTAEFILLPPGQTIDPADAARLLAAGPLIVKPAHEDASLGISQSSIVDDPRALEEQISQVQRRYGAALVERFIAGREFNVAIVALPEPEVLPLSEIEFGDAFPRNRGIVTYAAKWEADSSESLDTPVRCPANVTSELAEVLGDVALAAFRVCGCRGYARVDMRVDAAGKVSVLEVNGNPDIGPSAGFARALGVAGIEYAEFIERLVRTTHATRF